jgi:hypothetical protein
MLFPHIIELSFGIWGSHSCIAGLFSYGMWYCLFRLISTDVSKGRNGNICTFSTVPSPLRFGYILYFVDRASRHKFLLVTKLMHFFVYLFINFISLHVSSIKCSSSGDRIVLIHHLVWLVCVSDCLVCLSLLTGIPSSHLHRLIIPDDVLIQFDLLMMSTWCS